MVADSDQNATPEPATTVDVEQVEQVHLVLSPIALDIIVDALRSVGNVELAERLETILQQVRRPPEA